MKKLMVSAVLLFTQWGWCADLASKTFPIDSVYDLNEFIYRFVVTEFNQANSPLRIALAKHENGNGWELPLTDEVWRLSSGISGGKSESYYLIPFRQSWKSSIWVEALAKVRINNTEEGPATITIEELVELETKTKN